MNDAVFHETFCIEASHPALPGHFPGNPIVPGVILIDHVVAALQRWRGVQVVAIAQVKFLRPLLPMQTAAMQLSASASLVRFIVTHAGATIASGSLETSA